MYSLYLISACYILNSGILHQRNGDQQENWPFVRPPISSANSPLVQHPITVRVRGGQTNGQFVGLMGLPTKKRSDECHAPLHPLFSVCLVFILTKIWSRSFSPLMPNSRGRDPESRGPYLNSLLSSWKPNLLHNNKTVISIISWE